MKHLYTACFAAFVVLTSFPATGIAHFPQTDNKPLIPISLSDKRLKKYNVTASSPVLRGTMPVQELTQENSYGEALSMVETHLKETVGIEGASMTLTPTVTLERPTLISVYFKNQRVFQAHYRHSRGAPGRRLRKFLVWNG